MAEPATATAEVQVPVTAEPSAPEAQESPTPAASDVQGAEESAEPGDSGTTNLAEGEPEAEQAPPKPPAENAQTFKVALEDGEYEVPLEDLKKGYQLSFQARKDLEEAEAYIKSGQRLHMALLKNPLGVILEALKTQYQGDPHAEDHALEQLVAIVDEFKSRRLEYDNLPPEQKELRKLQRRNSELEAERERLLEERRRDERQAKRAETINRTLGEITQALGTAGLDKGNEVLQRSVAVELLEARKRNEQLSPAEAVKRVQSRLATDLEEKLKSLDGADPKTLQELFPTLVQKLRQAGVAEVKDLRSKRLPPRANGVKPSPAKQEVTILRDGGWDEIFGTK